MKKLITLLALVAALLTTAVSVFGQQIPQDSYSAEPGHYFDGTNVTQICVVWNSEANVHGATMFANFSESGAVTNMSFHPVNDTPYIHPSTPGKEANTSYLEFTNIGPWMTFAKQIRARFQILDEDTYVETVPYEYLGKSVILENFEDPLRSQALVFKNDVRLLAVPLPEWKGKIPSKAGEKVYIGRIKINGYFLRMFFPVTKLESTFLIDFATARQIALPKEQEVRLEKPQ